MDYNDGMWHGWTGGDCPVHEKSVVEAMWCDSGGEIIRIGPMKARRIAWGGQYNREGTDPVFAFRVVKEYRKPREIWVGKVSGITSTYEQPGMVLFREVIE